MEALDAARFEPLMRPERMARFEAVAEETRERLNGRAVVSVNSTAVGGGVAEMLQTLLAYACKGCSPDCRRPTPRPVDQDEPSSRPRLHHPGAGHSRHMQHVDDGGARSGVGASRYAASAACGSALGFVDDDLEGIGMSLYGIARPRPDRHRVRV